MTAISQIPSYINSFEFPHLVAARISKTARTIIQFLRTISDQIPIEVARGIKATKVLGFGEIVLSVPKFITNCKAALNSLRPTERVERCWQVIFATGSIVDGFADGIEALQAVGVIARDKFPWVEKVDHFLFPLKVVGLMRATQSFAEYQEFYSEMKGRIKPATSKESIVETCNYVIQNKERIQKSLKIGNEAKIDERARAIIENLQVDQTKAQEHAKEFTQTFTKRLNTKMFLEGSGLALRFSDVIPTSFSFFIPPNPITLAFAITSLFLSLVHIGLSQVLLRPNPFSTPIK